MTITGAPASGSDSAHFSPSIHGMQIRSRARRFGHGGRSVAGIAAVAASALALLGATPEQQSNLPGKRAASIAATTSVASATERSAHPTDCTCPSHRSAPARSAGDRLADAAAFRSLSITSDEIITMARGKSEVILTALPLAPDLTATLRLTPRQVLADSARATPFADASPSLVVSSTVSESGEVVDTEIALPEMVFLGGTVDGVDGSIAFIGAGPAGLHGFVALGDRTIIISSGPHGAGLPTMSFDLADAMAAGLPIAEFVCAADELPENAEFMAPAPAPEGGLAGALCHAIQIAVETDHEYLADLFGGDEAAASAYAMLLFGACSEIYRAQVGGRLEIVFLRLWPASNDPWNKNSTSEQLNQFKSLWNVAMVWLPRTLAHFLSGRSLGGGVAWLNALCSTDNGYGLSANLNGYFPYPLEDNVPQNWDPVVVAHELGHNFGAPHTHNYNPPLDGCGNGDCSGADQGTIMSYCHTCSGGMSNIALNFHPGNIPQMLGHMSSVSCLASGPAGSVGDDQVYAAAGITTTIDFLRNDFALTDQCATPLLIGVDAVSALGVALQLDPTGGPDGRAVVQYTAPGAMTGTDSFGYTADLGFGPVAGTVTVEVLPLRFADLVTQTSPGLYVSYYDLNDPVQLPDFTALDPYMVSWVQLLDFPSTGLEFATSGLSDEVGAVFTGYLQITSAGVYHLSTESDDGSRLLIGNTVVVDNDGLHGMVEKSGPIALGVGKHAVRVEFFERFGGAGLIVRMEGPMTARQVVPSSRWSWSQATADLNGDGVVNGADLGLMLNAWGACSNCPADLNDDDVVNGSDLGLLLQSWGE